MSKSFVTLAATASLALASTSASAAIIGGTVDGGLARDAGGVFVQLFPAAPFEVGEDNFDDNNLYAFDEVQDFALPEDWMGYSAGTIVSSHYVFFDPLATGTTIVGSVDFDSAIIKILTDTEDLAMTDAWFGNPEVTYLSPELRGLEPGFDSVAISGSTMVVTGFQASSPGDYIRVITTEVPEPATWAMMLLGFGAIGGMMRSRRRQNAAMSYS